MFKYQQFLYVCFSLLQFQPFIATSQNIEVLISGIRSNKGQIVIGIFKNNESFQDEKPFISKKIEKKNISNGEMTVTFSIDPGVYGLSLLDDENNNCKMNYNLFGLPEEGFGFSNYYSTGFTKPEFDKFKFKVNNNQKQKINIKVRYL